MNDRVVPVIEPGSHVIREQSLGETVRQRILAGYYRPGAWIREVELQREFGLSNGPVREALMSAVADGIAERAPFRGIRVIDLNEREIVELFEVRSALLGFAAELAAGRYSPEAAAGVAALEESLRNDVRDGNGVDMWLRGALSAWVFDLAGNERLREAYRRPLLQSLLYVAVARTHERERDVLLPFARAVIDAIVAGEPAVARDAVRALTLQTLHHLQHGTPLVAASPAR
jgi:DNA-binding GntR family transcriptional regulator